MKISRRSNRQKSVFAYKPWSFRAELIWFSRALAELDEMFKKDLEDLENAPMREMYHNDETQKWEIRELLLLPKVDAEEPSSDNQ
jgi:hypothetical protein